MAEALLITLILIVVTIAGILGFLYFVKITQTADNEKKIKLQGVVKHELRNCRTSYSDDF